MNKPDQVDLWLSSVAYEHSNSKATETQYKRVWREFERSAGATAQEIIEDYENAERNQISERTIKRKYSQIIQKYINELKKRGLTTTSIKVMVGAIMSFFKHNDLSIGHIPQARSGVTYHNKDITKDEINQIMAQCAIREKAFFAIMAQSGLRPHTIRQLRIEHLEKILSPDTPIPCKIDIPQEIEKGKFGTGHPTFIGEEAIKYAKQYLSTRANLKPDSLLFVSQTDESQPVNTKNISRTFRLSARKLEKTGAIKYNVRQGKPSELRLYNLRKYFRKYANQMGFEHVNYLMGHTTKGSDSNYTPKDNEFYKQLYEKQAMPFLRFETPTPTENDEIRKTLIEQHRKEIETIEHKHKAKEEELSARIEKLENLRKSEDYELAQKSVIIAKATVEDMIRGWEQADLESATKGDLPTITGHAITKAKAKLFLNKLDELALNEYSKPPTKQEEAEKAEFNREVAKFKAIIDKAYEQNPEETDKIIKGYMRKIIAEEEAKSKS